MPFLEDHLNAPIEHVLKVIQYRILNQTTYFGVPTLKNPFDFWVYQEILYEVKPDIIIEIGNFQGGSALALAHLCDAIGKGTIIGIDVHHKKVPRIVKRHPRIKLIDGYAHEVFDKVRRHIPSRNKVLVIEDSSHTYENTLTILRQYADLVSTGSYMIVEDGICHHGLNEGPKPGPYEAVETFIGERDDFELDRARESFFISWNPKGFLRRTGSKRWWK